MQLDLSIFNPKAKPLIGLDISSSAVKMVELSGNAKDGFRVERYTIEVLSRDVIADGNIVNLEAAAESVKRAWKRMGTSTRQVAMALPAAAVITKKIIVPAGQREEELEVLVESEANQYIPFALEEVNLDFQVIGPAPSSPDEVEVLIAASRKEKVEDRVAVAEAAGLKAAVMDVESYAALSAFELIERQLPDQGKNQVVAIVDIGANVTNLTVMRNGQQVYAREQAFGGAQLTQDIVRQYGMSFEEADAAKRNGGLPEDYEAELLRPFMESLCGALGCELPLPRNAAELGIEPGGKLRFLPRFAPRAGEGQRTIGNRMFRFQQQHFGKQRMGRRIVGLGGDHLPQRAVRGGERYRAAIAHEDARGKIMVIDRRKRGHSVRGRPARAAAEACRDRRRDAALHLEEIVGPLVEAIRPDQQAVRHPRQPHDHAQARPIRLHGAVEHVSGVHAPRIGQQIASGTELVRREPAEHLHAGLVRKPVLNLVGNAGGDILIAARERRERHDRNGWNGRRAHALVKEDGVSTREQQDQAETGSQYRPADAQPPCRRLRPWVGLHGRGVRRVSARHLDSSIPAAGR